MIPKEKAEELYISARKLHGVEKAKEESLKSANAVKALVPSELIDYWTKVIHYLNNK